MCMWVQVPTESEHQLSLELELQADVSGLIRELNSGPLQEQYILLTAEPSLDPWTDSFYRFLSPRKILSESLGIVWWPLSSVKMCSRITSEMTRLTEVERHTQCGWAAPFPGLGAWSMQKGGSGLSTRIYHTLLPGCEHNVTKSLKLLTLWHPHQRNYNWINLFSLNCFYQMI